MRQRGFRVNWADDLYAASNAIRASGLAAAERQPKYPDERQCYFGRPRPPICGLVFQRRDPTFFVFVTRDKLSNHGNSLRFKFFRASVGRYSCDIGRGWHSPALGNKPATRNAADCKHAFRRRWRLELCPAETGVNSRLDASTRAAARSPGRDDLGCGRASVARRSVIRLAFDAGAFGLTASALRFWPVWWASVASGDGLSGFGLQARASLAHVGWHIKGGHWRKPC